MASKKLLCTKNTADKRNNKRKDILESSNFLKYVFLNIYIAQNTIVGARKLCSLAQIKDVV